METILAYLPALLSGAVATIYITFLSMAIALVLGLFIALGRRSHLRPVRWALRAYVDFMRGTPLLLQLFYIYYVFPYIGIRMPALLAGVLGLSLNYAAYLSEVYRTSIDAIGIGQIEAARALGLRPRHAFSKVVFPQALRIAVPPIGNYFIAMFKDTALVAVISVKELMFTADQLSSTTYQYLIIYSTTFVIYYLISYPASMLVAHLERRMRRNDRVLKPEAGQLLGGHV
ncbi:ectoine/hydroxyectoine ABC transporter permease subunit EhuD [Paraburkholderia sp.]|uniref:ectoine/hydroxyectoine ABC transporter permease subunit EhuD n=1 Tax=Paraburkholderia sp. TaxID=1926495 RepID=UPI0039E3E3A3